MDKRQMLTQIRKKKTRSSHDHIYCFTKKIKINGTSLHRAVKWYKAHKCTLNAQLALTIT